ncbi:MAG: hypothetical protein ACKO13_13615 [Cytophagales bacterium]
MRTIFFLLSAILIAVSCDTPQALQPNETDYFLKFYGSDGDQTGVDFIVNDDGTFVLVGNSQKSTTSDWQIYVVKIGQTGEIIWEGTFGSVSRDEEARDIELLKNGELIIAGNSKPKNVTAQSDVYLLKLNQDGGFVDSLRQETRTSFENVSSVTEVTTASDSSELIVAGSISGTSGNAQDTDAMHMRFKIDRNLNKLKRVSELEWKTRPTFASFDFAGNQSAIKVEQLDDNTFFAFGTSKQPGKSSDFWYYTLSKNANAPINSTFIGEATQDEILTSVTRSGFRVVLTGIQSDSRVVAALLPLPLPSSSSATTVTILKIDGAKFNQPRLAIGKNGYWVAGGNIALARTNAIGSQFGVEQLLGKSGSNVGTITELQDGRAAIIGTMPLGGEGSNNPTKMVFMKLNPNGKLAP